jgi:hypothetical protein
VRESLEPLLIRELGRVAAPAELWGRIQSPPRVQSRSTSLAWAVAAGVLVVAGVWGLHPDTRFRSDKPVLVRDWVKSRTGLDVPLPVKTATSVRVTGASVKGPGAEIAFRVENHDATLLVSKAADYGDGKHRFLTTSSWTMHGQLYTIACADGVDPRVACVLCHTGAERLTAFN